MNDGPQLPNLDLSELVLDERDARAVFRYYWPGDSTALEGMEMTENDRLLAQKLLIAGVDATGPLVVLESMLGWYTSGDAALATALEKLANRMRTSTFKYYQAHAPLNRNFKITVAARNSVAWAQKSKFNDEVLLSKPNQ